MSPLSDRSPDGENPTIRPPEEATKDCSDANGEAGDFARAQLTAILGSSEDAIISSDLYGIIKSWNASAERLFGYSAEEAIGRPITMLMPPEQAEDEPRIMDKIRRGERIERYETIRRRKDGSRIEVSLAVSPMRDASDAVIGASKIARDITRRNFAEEATRRLAAIVESSDDAIVSKDLNGTILSWNAGAERLFGYTAAEAIGQSVTLLIPAGRPNEEPDILRRIREGSRVAHYETIRRRKDGTLLEVSLTVSPVRDGMGRIVGASKIARDISKLKAAAREIEIARDEALAASRIKDNFLAALSHELRTPLNPVLLLASNASEDPTLPENVREDFTTIRKNVELEARLIDDLLDINRITRGKISLKFGPIDLHALLNDAAAAIKDDLDLKRLTLTYELDPSRPTVRGDAVRLLQVLWNVLKNAVKFSTEGSEILIKTRCPGEPARAVIEIVDTGIGLTGAELERAFDPFAQGDHAHGIDAHQFGGLGLGLAISRRLLDLHRGAIRASSRGRDQGATFTIELPLISASERTAAAIAAHDDRSGDGMGRAASARRILLVEDHEVTRVVLAQILARRHFDVISAASAADAKAIAARTEFDLVISDIGLPDGTGYELMEQLRVERKLRGIALTGYGMAEDVARSHAAGFSTHLTKPVSVQALDIALAAALASPPR